MQMAARFHGIDVPVMAIREESGTVIITVQGGAELRCKFHDLMTGEENKPPRTQRKAKAKS